ncbi:MAG: hypothetical protein ASARMPREDX12_005069 [Alectoria sarmentosa]|nr:MAG: hypothetical protein ASARMPRED_005267 [Alectoria sarmentosa]CAD6591306.1 MAG: hypothetical protein ASARMPREDX12_005069 [Alectoria sarmentosa]
MLQRYPLRIRLKTGLCRLKAHLESNIANDMFLETELMMLAFATGIMDVVTFPQYHVFASNQTGNTALLAVGALGLGSNLISLPYVGTSLGLFAAGGLISGQLGNVLGRKRRLWLFLTNFIQTTLIGIAAGLRQHSHHKRSISLDLGIIALLAFASGAQVAVARTVEVPEVTTAMVTSAYIDFLVDENIFKLQNRGRNRRAIFVACLILGSFIGAITYLYVSPHFALYVSALGHLIVSLAFLFNHRAPQTIGCDS